MSYHALSCCAPSLSQGTSDVARQITKHIRQNHQSLRNSRQLGLDSSVFEELDAIAEECKELNWNGEKAHPVQPLTVAKVRVFLDALPLGTKTPSVGAEADGHITLEWYHSPRRVLSVSVAPTGELYYAALFGPNSNIQGKEVFFADIPKVILENIQRVFLL